MSKKIATSSFLHDDTKALYQPWRHSVYKSDIFVMAMKPAARWMYSTLLHEAFDYSTRPYLPDDDSLLWMLAGCESKRQWDQHKTSVRSMFTPVTINGQKLLSQKRCLEDWARMQEALAARKEHARNAGLASAAKRRAKSTRVNPSPTQVEPESTQSNQQNGTERNGTEPTYPPTEAGGAAGSPSEPKAEGKCAGQAAGKKKDPVLTFDDMQAAWTKYRNDNDADISIGLPRSGFPKLEENLRTFNLLARVDDIKRAFQTWLEDRYIPAMDTGNEINSPLSVFADDAVHYITVLEKATTP